jgi:hypothetical protein
VDVSFAPPVDPELYMTFALTLTSIGLGFMALFFS